MLCSLQEKCQKRLKKKKKNDSNSIVVESSEDSFVDNILQNKVLQATRKMLSYQKGLNALIEVNKLQLSDDKKDYKIVSSKEKIQKVGKVMLSAQNNNRHRRRNIRYKMSGNSVHKIKSN